MLLDDKEKELRTAALEELMGKLDDMDGMRTGSKKPVAAEVSVTKVEPKADLMGKMRAAGHEGVEAAEGNLFPEDEAKEGEGPMAGEEMGEAEGEKPGPAELEMIKKLYEKYFS